MRATLLVTDVVLYAVWFFINSLLMESATGTRRAGASDTDETVVREKRI